MSYTEKDVFDITLLYIVLSPDLRLRSFHMYLQGALGKNMAVL